MPPISPAQCCLITGATGMVGSYVMAELIKARVPIAVLARGKGKQSASDRIDAILRRFESAWNIQLDRPPVFYADLTLSGLGLSGAERGWIAQNCDQILHSAASLSFAPASDHPNNEPYRTNVDGTNSLIDFCLSVGLDRIHHVSTAYVCGMRSDRILESDHDTDLDFANDYERSKAIAESLIENAFPRESRTLYRPSIVVDPTGLAPVSGDRTIYGAFSMYQMLSSRFGLPAPGEWMQNLGFQGDERKNLIDAHWIAKVIAKGIASPSMHGRNYHLTAKNGTAIKTLDDAFRTATQQWLSGRRVTARQAASARQAQNVATDPSMQQSEIDQLAAPFVKTFLPYFRDDPVFDRSNIERAIAETGLPATPVIDLEALLEMTVNWSAPFPAASRPTASHSAQATKSSKPVAKSDSEPEEDPKIDPQSRAEEFADDGDDDDIVICGYAVRLPGSVNGVDDFSKLLFEGRSAIDVMPDDRLDRSLYFDSRRGVPGKTYTELGGCVDPTPLDHSVESQIAALGDFDLTHRQFAHVAVAAFRSASTGEIPNLDPNRGGVFVGHSGGTQSGGPLAMNTMAETAMSLIGRSDVAKSLPNETRESLVKQTTEAIRVGRPERKEGGGPDLNAYSAASLAARLTGLQGRREVIDAACSSSLIALQHAAFAIAEDRLDLAIVGGATFNNVDNLALFSQSGACSDSGCHPFDSRASGLISSEGYVAIVVARRRVALQNHMPIHGVIGGVGMASDGKGKGLWAPRSEGQQLAIKRAWQSDQKSSKQNTSNQMEAGESKPCDPLQVDYLECHATSTQVGDATELESLTALLKDQVGRDCRLPIGSAKSNLGHLLEAAGLVGVVKCLLAMRNNQIPPSIGFEQPNEQHDWEDSPIEVVDQTRPWPTQPNRNHKVAGVNAFGIGGLNAHAIIRERSPKKLNPTDQSRPSKLQRDRHYAIVGRGVVLPGAASIDQLKDLLNTPESCVSDAPEDRWISHREYSSMDRPIGVGSAIPHCRGAYVDGFQFDAQSYRIPPKLVQNANPAQLMLIEAVRQAIQEFDSHEWTIDRQKIGVSVGTIFGGQFSNELQVGLRLPEISRHIDRIAGGLGIANDAIDPMLTQFREIVLEQYPALLDETGGFTASTLASAIARVFNLMGGAYAVDADEASSGLAILSAMERLDRGDVDLMICGATHRAMDLVAFEQLYRKDQLVASGRIEDLPKDGSQIFPGEGVATILVQRLDDALAQGRTIYGVIENAEEKFATDIHQARQTASHRSIEHDHHSSYDIVQRIGHLGGAHGMVRTIAATLNPHPKEPSLIEDIACDGYQINYEVSSLNAIPNLNERSLPSPTKVQAKAPTHAKPQRVELQRLESSQPSHVITVCLEAHSAGAMREGLKHYATDMRGDSEQKVDRFSSRQDPFQAAIVATSHDQLREAATALIDGPLANLKSAALPRHSAWLRCPASANGISTGNGNRIAWLFPGQGSQYAEVPSLVEKSETARQFLNQFDAELSHFDVAPVSGRLHDPKGELGRNIWWTQLWVLATGTAQANELLSLGHRPDVVLGHSFGECTAAWCAGVMSTHQAIKFAKQRSEAVLLAAPSDGELLSVRGTPDAVKSALQSTIIDYTVTHHNAPEQTVIAGSKVAMAKAKQQLNQAGLASVVIPVPAAFHTPGMQSAQDLLSARFGGESVSPPRFGFLSAVSNRYLAEPTEILRNLIEQLTRPVCFASAVSRLADDGCGLMIEVGPSDVLTRLANPSVNGRAICLSYDDRGRPREVQDALIGSAIEAFGGTASPISAASTSTKMKTQASQPPMATSDSPQDEPSETNDSSNSRFNVVDVTKRQRSTPVRSSPASTIGSVSVVEPVTSTAPVSTRNTVPNGTQPASIDSAVDSAVPSTAFAVNGHESSSGSRLKMAKSFLFDLVVDLTGYDPEIVEFDADLEGELGVDSIKKAQLIGELVQWADLEIDLQSMRLADFSSLEDIIGLMGDEDISSAQNGVANRAAMAASVDVTQNNPSAIAVDAASLQRMIIDLVVDQTGYDEDIIDMDADLEGELGVDSIKRAQLIGELETHYNLQSLRDTNLRLSDFPTLASIHAYVLNHLQQSSGAAATVVGDQHLPIEEKKNDPPLVGDRAPAGNEFASASRASTAGSDLLPPAPSKGSLRFVIETVDAPRRHGMPLMPHFCGPALILGDNPIADEIASRLESIGVQATKIGREISADSVDATLDQIWISGVTPHLFLTTAHDEAATWQTSDYQAWQNRKETALTVPYRVCQRWMQRVIDDDRMPSASLVTIVKGGGNFAFRDEEIGVNDTIQNRSAESGGLAGLTKAMLIEAWMRGHRDTPMLVIDSPVNASAVDIVEGAFRELAVPSYDEEVVASGDQRQRTRARYSPLKNVSLNGSEASTFSTKNKLTKGGVWVVAGGGRGITAMTAMELAGRHDLKLHLLGMAPAEPIDAATRELAATDRAALRRQTMNRVQAEGGNPVKHWRNYEKAIEIDQTLLECQRRGIQATYHSVDVSDYADVCRVMDQIRSVDGPIHGVIQGAGSGQDARFDRKRPDKVAQCLSAKIDGCAALASATIHDPLEWFIGFGSISGRFGANGHTDYSAANDMLAKMIGRLDAERPDTRCFTFHWHAWGDIGMATKPEAKLALDMIGMDFMPAREGLQHFLNEIENGGDEKEVLITDRRYTRKFFPNDGEADDSTKAAILDPTARGFQDADGSLTAFKVTLDPAADAFLSEHLVHGRPTLPFVMAIEMLCEAEIVHASGGRLADAASVQMQDVVASRPLKCLSDDAFAIEIVQDDLTGLWKLVSDLRRKDGRMVEARREHFSGRIKFDVGSRTEIDAEEWNRENEFDTHPFDSVDSFVPEYLAEDAVVYHGPSLQCLREIRFADSNAGVPLALGTIVAPSPAQLGGENRPLDGWCISPAAMDAVLYAAGMLAYRVGERPSLPIRFAEIQTGRLPDPGEPLQVRLSWRSTVDSNANDLGGGLMSAVLLGQNGDLILQLDGYRVGWLG